MVDQVFLASSSGCPPVATWLQEDFWPWALRAEAWEAALDVNPLQLWQPIPLHATPAPAGHGGASVTADPGSSLPLTRIRTSGPIVGILEVEVLAARNGGFLALVSISTSADPKGQPAVRELAGKVTDATVGYEMGPVLFKPTLTVVPHTFRTTRQGALSTFVVGDVEYPNDKGSALNGWRKCEIKNAAIFIIDNTVTTMGNVVITDKTGKVVTVDKTWEFDKGKDGKFRIILHHSSLPYKPAS